MDPNTPQSKKTIENGLSYKQSGVDIEAGNALVEAIKPLAKSTVRSGVMSGLGGFGALFDLKAAGYKDPVLVAGTDGVGTKLIVANETDHHLDVGIDLVAMCVNDLIVQGAAPLFFLDYFATSKLDNKQARDVISGIAKGCEMANCALIGGETAEMPGLYSPGDYDLAGFCVGAAERENIIQGSAVKVGDKIIGLASSGVHSNGFSLVRKVVEKSGLSYHDPAPFNDKKSLGMALLEPTRIYVKSCLAALESGSVHGLAHITGGGLTENIPRILPDGLSVQLDSRNWPILPVFTWLAKTGNIARDDMALTFNCGIGMILIVDRADEQKIINILKDYDEAVYSLGEVIEHRPDQPIVKINDFQARWS